jgi:hypothetical protein
MRDKSSNNGGAYTIDFSPLGQEPLTLLKMTFGQNVPGNLTLVFLF